MDIPTIGENLAGLADGLSAAAAASPVHQWGRLPLWLTV